jgi:hypothetical protein
MDATDSPMEVSYKLIESSSLPESILAVDTVWRKASVDLFAPSRKTFDLMEIPSSHLRFASVTDYDPSSDQFTFRFFGTGFVEADGIEMTGKTHEDMPYGPLRDSVDELSRMVIAERMAAFTECSFLTPSGLKPFANAGRWPLSEDGHTVTGILTVADPLIDLYELNEILKGSS